MKNKTFTRLVTTLVIMLVTANYCYLQPPPPPGGSTGPVAGGGNHLGGNAPIHKGEPLLILLVSLYGSVKVFRIIKSQINRQ